MLFWIISIIFNQFVLSIIFLIAWVAVSIVGLTRMMRVICEEPVKEMQDIDFSVPLRMTDLLTWKGWIKLVSNWGLRKTLCLFALLNIGAVGAIFFTLSALDIIRMELAVIFVILAGIAAPIFFYCQIKSLH